MKRFGRLITTRHLWMALVVALIVALLVPYTVQQAAAQTVNYTAVVTTPRLNMRTGPGAGYPIVTALDQWTKVTLVGRNANSSWAKIRLANNTEGWASTFYMEPNVPWATLPVVTQQGNPSEPTGFVATGALNIRSGPGTQFTVLMTAGQGQALGLVGRDAAAKWLQVRISGKLGWASAAFIMTSYNIQNLPVTSGSVPTNTPKPAATSTPQGTPAPTNTPIPSSEPTAIITSGRLNVRSGPGAGYSTLATVVQGDVVTLLGRNSDASWLKVRTANKVEGWVSSLYVAALNQYNIYNLPVLAAVLPEGIIVTGTANVRSGPGIQYTPLFTLNYGSIVNLVARTSDVAWIKITYNGQTGWVGSNLIASDYNFGYLPVASQ